jgi:hypothetical protein
MQAYPITQHESLLAFYHLCAGEFLPDHVGLPLADGDTAKYFMLEIHYDNPGFTEGKKKQCHVILICNILIFITVMTKSFFCYVNNN